MFCTTLMQVWQQQPFVKDTQSEHWVSQLYKGCCQTGFSASKHTAIFMVETSKK